MICTVVAADQAGLLTCHFLCQSGIDIVAHAGDTSVELEIRVEGMVCGGCSSRVAEALKVRSANS